MHQTENTDSTVHCSFGLQVLWVEIRDLAGVSYPRPGDGEDAVVLFREKNLFTAFKAVTTPILYVHQALICMVECSKYTFFFS